MIIELFVVFWLTVTLQRQNLSTDKSMCQCMLFWANLINNERYKTVTADALWRLLWLVRCRRRITEFSQQKALMVVKQLDFLVSSETLGTYNVCLYIYNQGGTGIGK